jgi:hypothetical protein
MAINPIFEFPFPHQPESIATAPSYVASASYDITAATGYNAYVGQATETFTVDTVFFKVGSVGAGNSLTARVALENVSLTTGLPNVTLINPSASAAIRITAAVNYQVKFPGSVTVNRGDVFAIVIQGLAGSTPNNCRFSVFTDDNPGYGFPYTVDNAAAGTPVVTQLAPGIGLALSGVSGVPTKFCWPMDTAPTALNFTSPNVYGNRFTVRGKVRVSGVTVWGDTSVKAVANLYGTNGTTILASADWNANLPNNATVNQFRLIFPTPVTIDPGTYFLGLSCSVPTGGVSTIYTALFTENIWREASPFGGADVVYAYTSTGAPTGINSWSTVNTRQNFVGLMIDGVDDGAQTGEGGGGGGETSSIFFA